MMPALSMWEKGLAIEDLWLLGRMSRSMSESAIYAGRDRDMGGERERETSNGYGQVWGIIKKKSQVIFGDKEVSYTRKPRSVPTSKGEDLWHASPWPWLGLMLDSGTRGTRKGKRPNSFPFP